MDSRASFHQEIKLDACAHKCYIFMSIYNHSLSRKEVPIASHAGRFRRQISLYEAVALIMSGTIGAGMLGIPFVIQKAGAGPGIIILFAVGVLMMLINLLLANIAIRADSELHKVGLARKYLGTVGALLMGLVTYTLFIGVQAVYLIGEGATLAAMFGGSELNWSWLFFMVGAVGIALGVRTVKIIELALMLGLISIVLVIAGLSLPNINFVHWQYINLTQLFVPLGVLLFAFHGTTAVPEAYNILRHRDRDFRKAAIIAGVLTIIIYAVFALAVIGVTGAETSEIATVGLGRALGRAVFAFGNLFALIAMGTSFLMTGVALTDSFAWDLRVSRWLATLFVLLAPLAIFLLFGSFGFIGLIDFLGKIFITLELALILVMAYRAKVIHSRT